MKALQLLFNNFDLLLDQPDGVQQMKQTILQWAVQGKLVRQDPNDEPASELLKRIALEKAELIAQKKIKKQKALPPTAEDEMTFDLPGSWEWVKLGEICNLITDGTHHTPTYTRHGIPFLSVKDITSGIIDFSNTRFISPEEHKKLIQRCHPEYKDVLLTKVGTTGIAKVIDVKVAFSIFVSLALLKLSQNNLCPYFLELTINSPYIKALSSKNTRGIGNKNLVLTLIKSFPFPLPPLAEQHRIVAKVEELHTLCDQLEEEQQQVQTRKQALNAASLHQLSNAEDSEDFQSAWNIVSSRFEQLHDQPESVEPLRQAILQLAVRGKLVKQDPNDEPASELLKRIAEETWKIPERPQHTIRFNQQQKENV